MAIYHLTTRFGKVGKAFKHFKECYDTNDVLYKKNLFLENTPNSLFWKLADENEPVNGRTYREIEISLPYELSLEDNIKLVNEYVDSIFMEEYYYSIVIKKSQSESRNIYALIMFSERKIDGIERKPEDFFKKFCYTNPSKGGAKKEPSWTKKSKLFEIRQSWEDHLNEYLEIKNINKVYRKYF